MFAAVPAVAGTVEGTGSAINVSVGFQPSAVWVGNYDDAGTVYIQAIWNSSMPNASAFTIGAASSRITTGGITPYAGSTSASEGFTIGTNADLNANGETLYYIAWR